MFVCSDICGNTSVTKNPHGSAWEHGHNSKQVIVVAYAPCSCTVDRSPFVDTKRRQLNELTSLHQSTQSRSCYFSSSMTGASGAGCANKAKLATMTRCCCALSPGLPMVAPRLRRVMVARGGATSTVMLAFQLVITVAIPATSRARAISPTDCVQSGHDGTKNAASTRKSRATRTISGIISSTTRPKSG